MCVVLLVFELRPLTPSLFVPVSALSTIFRHPSWFVHKLTWLSELVVCSSTGTQQVPSRPSEVILPD